MAVRIGPRRRIQPDSTIAVSLGANERAADGAPSQVLGLDPQLYPPPGSRSLITADQVATVAAGRVLLPGCTINVERGWVAVIRGLTIFADAPAIDTRATWAVLVDGVPAYGLGAVSMLFRAAASLAVSFDTLRLVVPEGKRIEVQVTNVDGIPRVYGAQLTGWTMPRATLGNVVTNA